MGANWGFSRYGRRSIGTKITYSVTPAFDVNFKASGHWTDTKVDVDAPGAPTGSSGGSFAATPCGAWNGTLAGSPGSPGSAANQAFNACARSPFGDHRFIGVELGPGVTYRFAPGLTFDAVYAHLFAGDALQTSYTDVFGVYRNRVDAKDADVFAARVRYQF